MTRTTNKPNWAAQFAGRWMPQGDASGENLLRRITAAKEGIFAAANQTQTMPEHLLRLALNEAEALAWQTTYPHLVFPLLAVEKVHAVAAWNANQQLVRQNSPIFTVTE